MWVGGGSGTELPRRARPHLRKEAACGAARAFAALELGRCGGGGGGGGLYLLR